MKYPKEYLDEIKLRLKVSTVVSTESKFVSHYDFVQIRKTGRLPQSQVPQVTEEYVDAVIDDYHVMYCNDQDASFMWETYEEMYNIDCDDYR